MSLTRVTFVKFINLRLIRNLFILILSSLLRRYRFFKLSFVYGSVVGIYCVSLVFYNTSHNSTIFFTMTTKIPVLCDMTFLA
jgi:hypothetical protein